ncbi:DEAD/DEAH box helicase [Paenibacillus elgii]|uniref:DEAD/DEAH box helicase n=1 Tax=Paenibacillus elgii TaxID=189691 RepID=UPI00203B58EB|nr:DEAD/DEAH box helicase [Paenibacillus elgii]MCM3273046.1 DEAD/DEAH box helicase [Paenibacillus elgii]
MYHLRPYQEESVETMLNTKEGERTLIVLPTGAGKTVCFASVVSQTVGRVLILVPNQELREQSIDKIKRLDPDIDIGSVQGQKFQDFHAKVVVGTYQSIARKKNGEYRRINQMLEHGDFEMIIIDEVHLAVDQIKKIINNLNKNIKICGLTATPWNKKLVKLFGKPKYSKTILDMIQDGYLCEPECIQVETQTDLTNVQIVSGDYDSRQLEIAIDNDDRNNIIVKAYLENAHNRLSTLVFANSKSHIKSIVAAFTEIGVYAKGLDSDDDKNEYRKNVIEEFKAGKLPVLVNCGILTTGFDYERLDCIILARPTRSKILYAQCLGRGLRLHDDKNECLVIDIVDIVREHDICDISSFFEIKINSGETITKALKRIEDEKKKEEERLKAEEEKRKEDERKRIEEIKLKTQRFSLFNTEFTNAFEDREFDWWKVDMVSYALTYKRSNHYIIENVNNEYKVYDSSTDKEGKNIKYVSSFNNIDDALVEVETNLINSFNCKDEYLQRDSVIKLKEASDSQKQYCAWAKTDWDAHKYFCGKTLKKLLEFAKWDEVG